MSFTWPSTYQAAVSLSYDDGMTMQRDTVAPLLEDNGFRGTFYVPIHSEDFRESPDAWREVAAAGHELGNHTVHHPCYQGPDSAWGHDWYQGGWRNYEYYAEDRLRQELEIASFVLSLVDGKDRNDRTFGNTCCHNTIGPRDDKQIFDPVLADYFVAARGNFTRTSIDPTAANLTNLGHFSGDQRTADDVIAEIEDFAGRGHWGVYMIHGIGTRDRYGIDRHSASHGNWMDPDEHRRLVTYLHKNGDRIWTAPVVEVAGYVKQQR